MTLAALTMCARHARRGEVMAFARKLLGLEDNQPEAAPPDISGANGSGEQGGQPSGLAEKRVRNEKIKQELGVRLTFPSFREGLAAIAEKDYTPFL